jgi:hypothetical protein
MEPKAPSFIKIIWNDYNSFLALTAIIVASGMLTFDQLSHKLGMGISLFYMTAIVFLIGIPVIFWRVRLISSAFEFGWEAEADITNISFFRDRGKVTYVFTIQGERYQVSNAIMKTKFTRSLQRGQKVIVIAQRDNPRMAFIRDMYS